MVAVDTFASAVWELVLVSMDQDRYVEKADHVQAKVVDQSLGGLQKVVDSAVAEVVG